MKFKLRIVAYIGTEISMLKTYTRGGFVPTLMNVMQVGLNYALLK